MDDSPFIGEVRLLAHDRVPRGWQYCLGQGLSIAAFRPLYEVIGTTYGGDGIRTFALPDLGGIAPAGAGQAPGLSSYDLGGTGGTTTVTLVQSEMPRHSHAMMAAAQDPATAKLISADASWSLSQGGAIYQSKADTHLAPQALMPTGGGTPHNNMQPYLVLTFCIATEGDPPTSS